MQRIAGLRLTTSNLTIPSRGANHTLVITLRSNRCNASPGSASQQHLRPSLAAVR
jgi:hypothetical protein